MSTPNGLVLWEDNKTSRVAIAVLSSTNRKTGNMIQVYILDRNNHPVEALKTGEDKLICGDCPLRNNGCYVEVWQAPAQVWKQYHAGKYPRFTKNREHINLFNGRSIRWGSYGDPAFIPYEVITYFNSLVVNWTGYTHQWRTCDPVYANVFMASVEKRWEVVRATEEGWRTFHVNIEGLIKQYDEVICPASKEGGTKTHCLSCNLCNGSRGPDDPRKNIIIQPHGKNKRKLIQIL